MSKMSLSHYHCALTMRNDWPFLKAVKHLIGTEINFSQWRVLSCEAEMLFILAWPRYQCLMFDEDMTGPHSGCSETPDH